MWKFIDWSTKNAYVVLMDFCLWNSKDTRDFVLFNRSVFEAVYRNESKIPELDKNENFIGFFSSNLKNIRQVVNNTLWDVKRE